MEITRVLGLVEFTSFKMKLLIGILLALAAVNASDIVREIRPIQEYVFKHPERYVAWHKLNNMPRMNGFGSTPSREARIVGGEEAVPGSYPYQIALFITVSEGKSK